MTPKTPKYTPNNSQTQAKTGGVDLALNNTRKQFLDTLENIKLREILGENQVSQRIFFIRHGITEDDEKPENKGKPQKTESKLSKDGREQLEKTAHRLKESGIKPEETLFIYSDDKTVRVQESMGIILEEFGFNLNSPQVEKNEKLNTSEKKETENGPEYHQDEYRLLIDMGVMVETIKLMKEIRTEEKYRKYKNIVLVGHKSNKAGITESVTNTNRPIRGDVSIKNGEILESDIGINGRYINYQKNKDLLFVNSYNYKELKEIFPDIPHSSIIEFQNKLNGMFMENKGLFEEYVGSENVDLRAFCIVNLLKNNEKINIIENYYKNINKSILEKEEQILWENRKNSNCYNILGLLAKKGLLSNPSMKYNFENYVKILNIQSRSLDEKIKKQESDGILKRNLFLVEKKEIETKDKDGKTEKRIEYINKSIDISEIISSAGKYILPAHVGNGKSIWLSEFAKRAILYYPEYKIYFFEGSDFNGDNKDINFNKIKDLLENQKENTLIFVDAIDEINDSDMKSEIKNLLQQTKNKTIITARLSEYNDKENGGFKTLGFNSISKDEFINSRISDKKIRGEVLKALESSNLSQEVEGNPLLLNFICILANLDEKDKKKYESLGIKSLENILNKADLYESISRLIIYKHNEPKLKNITKRQLELYIKDLGEIAFNLHSNSKNNVDLEDGDLQELNIIFKKSENQEEYQFIHNSFYEFFLARHLVNIPNGNEEIYKVRDENEYNWNKWREFKPVVIFYGESLINSEEQEQFERLENLFYGLPNNDDGYSEGFFMGLEILYRLGQNGKLNKKFQKMKNLYLNAMKGINKEFLINKIILFQEFQKRIGYENNIFADVLFKKMEKFFLKTYYEEVLKLGSVDSIKLILNFVQKNEKSLDSYTIVKIYVLLLDTGNKEAIEASLNFMKRYENGIKDKTFDSVYYNYFINNGNKEAIKQAVDFASRLDEQGNFKLSQYIYLALILKGNQEYIKNILNIALEIENKKGFYENDGDIYDVSFIYTSLSTIGNQEVINQTFDFIHRLDKKGDFFLDTFLMTVEIVANSKNEKLKNKFIDIALDLRQEGKFKEAIDILRAFVFTGNQEAIKLILDITLDIKYQGELEEVIDIYYGFIPIGNQEALKQVLNISGEYYQQGKYQEAGEIIYYLINVGNEEIIKQVLFFASELYQKSEIDIAFYIAREFEKQGDFYIAGNIYIALISTGNMEIIGQTLNIFKNLDKKIMMNNYFRIIKKMKELNLKMT